jgi:hypothetical protein
VLNFAVATLENYLFRFLQMTHWVILAVCVKG